MSDTSLAKTEHEAGVTLKSDYQNTRLGIIPRTVDEALTIAKAFASSGYFRDIQNASQAVAKIMYGSELGMTAASSMQGIYFFDGKLVLGGTFIAAIIKKSGKYKYKILQSDKKACRIEFFERDGDKWESQGISAFTIEDAATAKLTGKDNWVKFSHDMLYNRAMSAGSKRFTPDIFGGMAVYTEDELDEIEQPEPMRNAEVSQSEKIRAKIAPDPAPVLESPKAELKLTQQEVITVSQRLSALDGTAPSPTVFIKQCREDGMTTFDEVSAAIDATTPAAPSAEQGEGE